MSSSILSSDLVTIVRSRRKTLAIEVRDNQVLVKAPLRAPVKFIDGFLKQKQLWITQQLEKQAVLKGQQLRPAENHPIPFLGKSLTLKVCSNAETSRASAGILYLSCKENTDFAIRDSLHFWLKQEAGQYIRPLAFHYLEKLGLEQNTVKSFRFSKTKSKWGSCHPDGRLQFNWLIMLAPEQIVHYLVCHELSHLLHANHSPAFWKVVNSIHPQYRDSRNWLNSNGHTLWID